MQVNARQTQLRDVLHTIASNSDLEPCVSSILDAALQGIDHASGAGLRSFESPSFSLTVGDITDPNLDAGTTASLDFAMFNAPLIACPIRTNDQVLGVLVIETDAPPSESARDLLSALVDAAIIVLLRAHQQFQTTQVKLVGEALLNGTSDPLLIFDVSERLLMANPAAAAIFAVEPGKALPEVLHADDLNAFALGQRELNEWSAGDKVFTPRLQHIGDEEQTFGWILVLHDITQYKKLSRSQNEFIRIVSHDIRSPLTSMRGFADMMGMVGDLNEKQEQFIEKVLSGIAQITALVENIQDAGRFDVETGFYEMTRSQCDLREMVNRIVNNHLIPAEKQSLTIHVTVDEGVPIINGDSNMLERAITNLVDNAIKYTPDGGKIDVMVYNRDRNLFVSVRDNGLGISPENQKQLFQRHVRLARQEHKKIKGSGLGLFIVKSVAQRHGGDAWVESQENLGSTFSFNIPLKGANLVIPEANGD